MPHSTHVQKLKKCFAEALNNASLNGLDYLHFLEMNTNSLATAYESVNSSALVELKVSDKMFEGGKYPFSCSIYDGYGLCIFTEYKQFVPWQCIDCNCQIPSYKLY